MDRKKKTGIIIFIVLYFAMLTIPAVTMVLNPSADLGENRELSAFPVIYTRQDGLNLSFFSEFDTWLNEHIGLRSELIDLNNAWQLAIFGQSPEESIIAGRDGWLYYSETAYDYLNIASLSERNAQNIAHTLKMMQEYAKQNGAEYEVAIVPNKSTLYGEYMPYYYIPTSDQGNLELLYDAMDAQEVCYVNLYETFAEEDEILYLATDSHWNYQGALLAYRAILDGISYQYDRFDDITFRRVKDWKADLANMLYADSAEYDWQTYPEYDFHYEVVSHETAVDAITLQTECAKGSGSLLMFRDSFCNTMQVYFAETFEDALFSRAYPFRMDYVSLYDPDVVILEIVERNIANLAAKAPVMPAPEVQLDIDVAAMPGENPALFAEETEEYMHLYGYVDPSILGEDYQVFLYCRTGEDLSCFEAFPIYEQELLGSEEQGDYGFSAYLSADQITGETEISIIIYTEGKYFLSDSLT